MFEATTILAVRDDKGVAMAGDGQVTFNQSNIMKSNARKVRRLYNDKVIAGFAGSVADAFTLFERFEAKLQAVNGNLTRAAIELAKDWRQDKYLQKLEAMLLVSDGFNILLVSGGGEVIEPEDGICAIGSGGMFALSAAKALKNNTNMDAESIAMKSLNIAADVCVFTNHNIVLEYAAKEAANE